MTMARRRAARPDLPHEELGRLAALPKPHLKTKPEDSIDTSGLPLRKIHPFRDEGFLHWLTKQLCVIFGLIDAFTEQPHICWSPGDKIGGQFRSDPMHLEKAYSGRTKRDDRKSVPGCRHAHNLQEGRTAKFCRRFGIDLNEKADEYYERYLAEKERGR